MNRILSRVLFPASVSGSFLLFLYARHIGAQLQLVVLLSSIAIVATAAILERITPYRRDWNKSRGDLATDLTSATILIGAVEPLLKWLAPITLVSLYGLLQTPGGFQLFPTDMPLLAQIALATLIAEFGAYWSHRWHHTSTRLWWLHALHHSSERMYTLNNFRMHPLNHALNYLIGIAPLLLLGVPTDVLLGYLALTQPVLMLQHANLPLKHGVLNYVFSTNEVHRWHHANVPSEGNNNYGRALVIWDIVFGTFLYSRDGTAPQPPGLYASSRYPGTQFYFRQLWSMFRPDCCAA